MENLVKHKADFSDGFKDGYLRAEKGDPCRWQSHHDINDGFKSINPIYTLAYEGGYNFQKMGKDLTDETVEDLFLQMVRHFFSKHHKDNNKD